MKFLHLTDRWLCVHDDHGSIVDHMIIFVYTAEPAMAGVTGQIQADSHRGRGTSRLSDTLARISVGAGMDNPHYVTRARKIGSEAPFGRSFLQRAARAAAE